MPGGLNRTPTPPVQKRDKGEIGEIGTVAFLQLTEFCESGSSGDAYALPGRGGWQAGFQGRAGYAPVRVSGVGVRRAVRRAGSTRHRTPGARPGRYPLRHRGDLRVPGAPHCAPGPGRGSRPGRRGQDPRFRAQRADPGPGPRRAAGRGVPGHQGVPGLAGRRGPGTAGSGQREPAANRLPGPVPGAPARSPWRPAVPSCTASGRCRRPG